MQEQQNKAKQTAQQQLEGPEEEQPRRRRGVAGLFAPNEIKDLFLKYLILVGVLELFIFFVSFVSQLGPENQPFPWKSFFFAAFVTPLALTFLLGVVVAGFDHYLEGHNPPRRGTPVPGSDPQKRSKLDRLNSFLFVIRQVPFLLGLLLLIALAGIVYKLDAILLFLGHAGETTAQYLLIAGAVLLAVSTVVGLLWMILNYRLRRQTMDYQYQYRKDVVERMGLVILDDETVMDRHGQRRRSLPRGKKQQNGEQLLEDQQEPPHDADIVSDEDQ